MNDVLNPFDFGAVATGALYPLSTMYASVTQARKHYPGVTSLGESRDRVALQACLDRCTTADSRHYGRRIYVPAGRYFLDKPLILDTAVGVVMEGSGTQTQLLWNAPDSPDGTQSTALWLAQCQSCSFRYFSIHAAGQTGTTGIRLTNREGNSDGVVSTQDLFHRIDLDSFTYGISVLRDPQSDQNNDSHVFEYCNINESGVAGVFVIGSQAHFLRFQGCSFQAPTTTGTYAIWCKYGAYVHCQWCTFNGHETAVRMDDFFPGVCSMLYCNGENNRRWLTTYFGGGHGGIFPIVVQGCRGAVAPQAGDYTLDFNHDGPISVRDNTFYSLNTLAPGIACRYGSPRLTHENNEWTYAGPWNSSAVNLLSGAVAVSARDWGNTYIDSRGSIDTVPDVMTPVNPWLTPAPPPVPTEPTLPLVPDAEPPPGLLPACLEDADD